MSENVNPFLIGAPPGFVAPPPAAEPAAEKAPEVILLPPGLETVNYRATPTRGVEKTEAPLIASALFPTPGAAILPVGVPLVVGEEPASITTEAQLPTEVTSAPEVVADAAVAAIATATWRLVLPNAEPVAVEGAVLLGRHPEALPEYPMAAIVRIVDPNRSVSKSHALLGVDGTGLWVADLGSTNGTFVRTPTGGDARVDPGAPVYAPVGSSIELGQYRVQVAFD